MGDRALHPEQLKVKIEELKVIRTPAGNFELLTFNSQLGKLGIAPVHPIGYNDGRFGEEALFLPAGGQAKGQVPHGHWPPNKRYEPD
jgi:hypothetical protein